VWPTVGKTSEENQSEFRYLHKEGGPHRSFLSTSYTHSSWFLSHGMMAFAIANRFYHEQREPRELVFINVLEARNLMASDTNGAPELHAVL